MGVQRYYETVEELDIAIQSYFDEYETDVTIPGLAYHLGFESRQSIYDYKEREVFSYSIKRAILKIESIYAAKLAGQNVTGIIFALKNMGWKDKTETEISGGLNNTVEYDVSKISNEALKELLNAATSDKSS